MSLTHESFISEPKPQKLADLKIRLATYFSQGLKYLVRVVVFSRSQYRTQDLEDIFPGNAVWHLTTSWFVFPELGLRLWTWVMFDELGQIDNQMFRSMLLVFCLCLGRSCYNWVLNLLAWARRLKREWFFLPAGKSFSRPHFSQGVHVWGLKNGLCVSKVGRGKSCQENWFPT